MILSPRQAQIMALLAQGMPAKCVAEQLGIGLGTLHVQLSRIRRANGLSSTPRANQFKLAGMKRVAALFCQGNHQTRARGRDSTGRWTYTASSAAPGVNSD